MTAILGISAYYHDSAAALVIDGEIVIANYREPTGQSLRPWEARVYRQRID